MYAIRSYYDRRDSDGGTHGIDQFDIKPRVGSVLIEAVQENLTRAQLLADVNQGNRINRTSYNFV